MYLAVKKDQIANGSTPISLYTFLEQYRSEETTDPSDGTILPRSDVTPTAPATTFLTRSCASTTSATSILPHSDATPTAPATTFLTRSGASTSATSILPRTDSSTTTTFLTRSGASTSATSILPRRDASPKTPAAFSTMEVFPTPNLPARASVLNQFLSEGQHFDSSNSYEVEAHVRKRQKVQSQRKALMGSSARSSK